MELIKEIEKEHQREVVSGKWDFLTDTTNMEPSSSSDQPPTSYLGSDMYAVTMDVMEDNFLPTTPLGGIGDVPYSHGQL